MSWAWRPQEGPQQSLVDCPMKEIFFGGTRAAGRIALYLNDRLLDPISR